MVHFIPTFHQPSHAKESWSDKFAYSSLKASSASSFHLSTLSAYYAVPYKPSFGARLKQAIKNGYQKIKSKIQHMLFLAQDGLQILGYMLKKMCCCIRLPNFHKVNSRFFRGGQPTKKGFSDLEKKGIKTIISLRKEKSDENLLKGKLLNYAHFSFDSTHPTTREVIDFLRIVTNPTYQPVFVHCYFGADRTGLACAIYRIFVDGWTKAKAIKEMRNGGYGFHNCYRHFVDYIHQLDVKKIKAQLQFAS